MSARGKAIAPRKPYDLDGLTDVALHVFAERGYDGASMDDVALAAGISKAAIYHHVPSKEALLERGIGRALDALDAIPERARAIPGTPLERLRFVVRATAILALDLLPELTVLIRVRGNSVTERRAIGRRRAFDRTIAELVRRAQKASELDLDLDPNLTVRLVFGTINSVVEWYRPGGKLTPTDVADELERMIFAGILRR